ncbi:signal peptidase I [Methanogenium cariaci]
MRETIPIRYVGPSMNPTFQSGDLLTYTPVPVSELTRGDVIVFQSPQEPILVIHRVIAVENGTIRTRGDNNSRKDTYLLTQADIRGRVVSGTRGKERLRVYHGTRGRMQAGYHRKTKSLQRCCCHLVQPCYAFLSEHRIVSRWTGRWLKVRVTAYERPAGREQYARLCGRTVAHRPAGSDAWCIYPPYRMVIDSGALSFPEEE